MDVKKLCLDLVYCDKEEEVISLLKKNNLWDASESWHYYGDAENNFATIGNQQNRPEAALVEKIVNSVDAMLIAECWKKGIRPTGKDAPQSINEALIRFFNLYEGKLSSIPAKERSRLAENISLVATGGKSNPCYLVIDQGEGQTPEKFPETLLSIGKSNKLRIPFVQGKFNMGGTGVLQFCGRQNLQLILSKRNPELAKKEKDTTKDSWGFTIVRRENPSHGVRSSIYRYLAPSGQVLSFKSNRLPIFPGHYPQAYGRKLEYGTLIKLYEYQMTGLKTNILFDLYNRLSILMPTIALPVRFFERRKGYSGHTMETTLSGLSVRLDEDKRENLEDGFPSSCPLSAMSQKMTCSIFAFKKGNAEKYTKDEGIIFTINGQTHAHLSKAFFSRKAVGMGYLADSTLVITDCSEFDGRSREDLFMNSRDRLRSGDLRSEIEQKLEETLRKHEGLRELREKRRREEIQDKLGDSKPLADVIENIIKRSPTLSKLFIEGFRLPDPFRTVSVKPKPEYKGKQFPTYFKLTHDFPKERPKLAHVNSQYRIQYSTDVVNDYFSRDKDPGSFSLTLNGVEISDYACNLWNGLATLSVDLPSDCKEGEILHFKSTVADVSTVEPFEEEFFVKVTEPLKPHKGGKGERKEPPSEEEGEETEKEKSLALPNVIPVRQAEWARCSDSSFKFDKESVLKVVDTGEKGYDFFINMDNIHLLTEKKINTSIDSQILDARYQYGMVLFGIALLKNSKKDKEERSEEEKNIYQIIWETTKAISPILLPMIASLGSLEVEEVSQVYSGE